MNKKLVGLLAGAAFYGLCVSTAQAFMIDPFKNGSVDAYVNHPNVTALNGIDVSEVIGGVREIQVNVTTSTSDWYLIGSACNSCSPDLYRHYQRGAPGNIKVHWDGDNDSDLKDSGLGNFDLTDSGTSIGFELKIDTITGAGGFTTLSVWDEGSLASVTISSLAVGTHFVPFSGFTGTVDWTKIDAVEMMIGNTTTTGEFDSYEVYVDYIKTSSQSQIPEPTTIALMGLGLAGIGYRRHRNKIAV